eukprot:3173363-Rhodomonas_salina.3
MDREREHRCLDEGKGDTIPARTTQCRLSPRGGGSVCMLYSRPVPEIAHDRSQFWTVDRTCRDRSQFWTAHRTRRFAADSRDDLGCRAES